MLIHPALVCFMCVVSSDEAFRGSFSNLSISSTASISAISDSNSTLTPASSSGTYYMLRLTVSSLVEGLDILDREMAIPIESITPITQQSLNQTADVVSHAITKCSS